MGLLDFKMPDMDSPQGQGLLAAAFSLMGAKGNSMSDAVGDAGMKYMGVYQQARGLEDQKKLRDLQLRQAQMQMDEAERKAAIDKQMREMALRHQMPAVPGVAGEEQKPLNVAGDTGPNLFSTNLSNMSTPGSAAVPAKPAGFNYEGYFNDLATIDPLRALEERQKLKKAPIKLGVDETLYDPDTFKPIATNPKRETLDVNKPFLFVNGQIIPNPDYQNYEIRKAAAGAARNSSTVHLPPMENEYLKSQGKEYSELMAGINKSAFSAPAGLRRLDRMVELLDGVEGGKFAPMGTEIASALNSFGIKVDPKLGNKEASIALSREMAGMLRQPGTGPMTDKDFDNFLAQMPDLSKSAQGRKMITETMRRAYARDIEISKRARAYEKRVGKLDGGFVDEIAQFIAENPVVASPAGYGVKR